MGTDDWVERTCADHMAVMGLHASGCVSTLEAAGGAAGRPFEFELLGEKGWLRITGGGPGGYQAGRLALETSLAGEGVAAPASDLPPTAVNVSEVYARLASDIRSGERTVPDFASAVRIARLLELIDAASDCGERRSVAA